LRSAVERIEKPGKKVSIRSVWGFMPDVSSFSWLEAISPEGMSV
jgi:hypothetical protein